MEMQGRAVIVTGGASGIGKATALLLAHEGARVFVGDVDETGGQAVAAEAAAERLAIEYLPLELTDPSSITGFSAAVHQRVERVDGLVNGAGWDQIQPFLENPPEMWDRVVAINLMGAVRLTRGVLPSMVAAHAGKIVNISSDAGRVGSMGETVYAAAKGGLIAFTKSRARTRPLPDQRQLRLSRADRHATVPAATRPHEGGVYPRNPVPLDRPTDRNRASRPVLFEPTIRLHHRSSTERQRWIDHGGLSKSPSDAMMRIATEYGRSA